MKELIEMWKHTRIVSFFILSTALYAVFLWIFAQLPVWIIPGVTSLRPANAIPIVCSLLFGPAAAWGTAFGNLIGYDLMSGALTIGSIGGFIGNFVMGLVPYYVWRRIFKEPPHCKNLKSLAAFELVNLLHASSCGFIIALWTELVGFVPFTPIAFIITFNNFLHAAIISPILMGLFYDRAVKAGWLWTDIMSGYTYTPKEVKSYHKIGFLLTIIGGIVGDFVCIILGLGLGQPLLFGPGLIFVGTPLIATGLVFLIIFIVGLALLSKD
jgi:energy-coupling factor transport system substrate-specific component